MKFANQMGPNSNNQLLRCAWKPGGSSLAPYDEGTLDTRSSLAPFQAPARLQVQIISWTSRRMLDRGKWRLNGWDPGALVSAKFLAIEKHDQKESSNNVHV